jgi:hypothetical protein
VRRYDAGTDGAAIAAVHQQRRRFGEETSMSIKLPDEMSTLHLVPIPDELPPDPMTVGAVTVANNFLMRVNAALTPAQNGSATQSFDVAKLAVAVLDFETDTSNIARGLVADSLLGTPWSSAQPIVLPPTDADLQVLVNRLVPIAQLVVAWDPHIQPADGVRAYLVFRATVRRIVDSIGSTF